MVGEELRSATDRGGGQARTGGRTRGEPTPATSGSANRRRPRRPDHRARRSPWPLSWPTRRSWARAAARMPVRIEAEPFATQGFANGLLVGGHAGSAPASGLSGPTRRWGCGSDRSLRWRHQIADSRGVRRRLGSASRPGQGWPGPCARPALCRRHRGRRWPPSPRWGGLAHFQIVLSGDEQHNSPGLPDREGRLHVLGEEQPLDADLEGACSSIRSVRAI